MNAYRLRADVKWQLNITSEEQLKVLVEALQDYKRKMLDSWVTTCSICPYNKAYAIAELSGQLPELE